MQYNSRLLNTCCADTRHQLRRLRGRASLRGASTGDRERSCRSTPCTAYGRDSPWLGGGRVGCVVVWRVPGGVHSMCWWRRPLLCPYALVSDNAHPLRPIVQFVGPKTYNPQLAQATAAVRAQALGRSRPVACRALPCDGAPHGCQEHGHALWQCVCADHWLPDAACARVEPCAPVLAHHAPSHARLPCCRTNHTSRTSQASAISHEELLRQQLGLPDDSDASDSGRCEPRPHPHARPIMSARSLWPPRRHLQLYCAARCRPGAWPR